MPPLVLLHGWGSSSKTWGSVSAELNREYDLVFLDLPGFGDNTDVPVTSVPELLEELGSLLPEECYLLGWSLGGMIATQLAARYPGKIRKLITLATNVSFVASESWATAMPHTTFHEFCTSFSADPEKTFSRFCALQVQGEQNRRQVLTQLKALQPKINPAWRKTLAWLGEIQNREILSRLAQPCLHLYGDNDALVPASAAKGIAVCHTQHKVEIFAGTGHAVHLSQPQTTVKKILAFLHDSPYRRSKQALADSFGRAANKYESVAVLQKKVAHKLVSLGPAYSGDIADLGCGTGFCAELIRHENNSVFAMDLARGMLQIARARRKEAARWIGGDMESLPFASQTLDGVISSMSVQWCEDPVSMFAEVHRVLKPGGWFLFSTLGPQTLHELAVAWKAVDEYVHVNNFCDESEVARMFENKGFAVQRAEKNIEKLYYDNVLALMRDLKTIGAHNINAGQNPGLTGRQKLQGLQLAYEPFRDHSGRLPATYDVYYFLLRKPGD